MELIVFVGIPASGKSTKSVEYRNAGYCVVSSDEIRSGFMDGKSLADFSAEEQERINAAVFDTVYRKTEEALSAGVSVVVDATHLNRGHRTEFLKYFEKFECPKKTLLFITPFEVCLLRNRGRTGAAFVPENVMHQMLGWFNCPDYSEGWDEIIPIVSDAPFTLPFTETEHFEPGTDAFENCSTYLYLVEKCDGQNVSPNAFREILQRK